MSNVPPKYDLLLKSQRGAKLFNPERDFSPAPDIGFADGEIIEVGSGLQIEAAKRVQCVTGNQIICPPLTDIHTHYSPHSPWGHGMDPAEHGISRGVVQQVDAGTTGMYNFEMFCDQVMRDPRIRGKLFALLNIAPAGLATQHRELRTIDDFEEVNPETTAEMAATHPGEIVGIKVRIGWLQTHPSVWQLALRKALEAAALSKLPLMVHISDGPPTAEVLRMLRPGDIVTHCFHGRGPRDASIMTDDGKHVQECVKQAQCGGILFDVGHGQGSFNVHNAKAALDDGFLPNTVSSDLHSGCVHGPTYDLPRTVSKMLSLGLTLPDALRAVTRNAANALKLPYADLAPGAPAQCTVLEVIEPEGGVPFTDADTNQWKGDKLVQTAFVVA